MTGPEGSDRLDLRPATVLDLDAVAGVHARARAAAPMPPADAGLAGWVEGWDLDRHEVWVALAGDTVVGYLRLTRDWLDDLYVDPAHQGVGVGTALLALVQSLRPGGFSLWVFEANLPARRFYAARGLVELEHTDGSANAEREPDLRMAWPGERPLSFLRSAIDDVDDELAPLLARRFALAGAVQDHKAAAVGRGGLEARDPAREAEIVRRMATRAPSLDPARLERVMALVLEEGLADWHARRDEPGDPV